MTEILGTTGEDTLIGTDQDDNISGLAGNDTIDGGDGNDIINGGKDNDSIDGGAGNDTIIDDKGDDTIDGGSGNDTIIGGKGADIINGTDSIAAGAGEIDDLTGSNGADTDLFILGDDEQAYYITAGNSDYAIINDFQVGLDLIQLNGLPEDYSLTQVDTDTHLSQDGELVAILKNITVSDLDLNKQSFRYVGSGITIIGDGTDETLEGTEGFDYIQGDSGNDTIDGGAGNDIIDGGAGNDIIDGGAGNDTIIDSKGNDTIDGGDGDDLINDDKGVDIVNGGSGNDTISGGKGADIINGTDSIAVGAGEIDDLTGGNGAGTDLFILGDDEQAYYITAGDSDYAIINDFQVGLDLIQLNGLPEDYSLTQVDTDTHLSQDGELVAILKNITVSDLDLNKQSFRYVGSGITIIGDGTDETLEGTEGFDYIQGDSGNDTIDGAAGNDIIDGGNGNDIIDGGAGNDTIIDSKGDDTINGGDGDDLINDNKGIDIINGGPGNDTIIGGKDADIINGTDSIAAGAGEIDDLTGSTGADTDLFILGDDKQAYYISAGDNDYAVINNFQVAQDTIQLNGSAQQYNLIQTQDDVELRLNTELIAVLKGLEVETLDLTATYFQYVSVVEENTAPVAQNDEMSMEEDATFTIAASILLANDSDPDLNDVLQITEVDNAVNGTVSLDGNGQVIFIPIENFNGEARFDYTVSDGELTSSATVNIDINAVNDAPTTSGIEGFTVTNNAPNSVINLYDMFEDVEDADTDLTYAIAENTNTDLFSNIAINDSTGELILDYANGAEGVAELTIQATDLSGATTFTEFAISVLDETFWNDLISGSSGDDYLRGNFGSDNISGQKGDDTIEGNWGRDSLFGDDGHDYLLGGFGSDSLSGGADNDRLNGAGNYSVGFLEKDTLEGGEGADTFILGNEHKSYYQGAYWFDYALIKDFNEQEDTILLHGSADDYETSSNGDKTYLYAKNSLSWSFFKDLVAVFENSDGIDLQSGSVEFLG